MGEEPSPHTSPNRLPVCAIGASAGGVSALQKLFQLLPADLGVAYIVVMHLAPDQPSVLHELLAAHTRMRVDQVQDVAELKPDHVYVISPKHDLVVVEDQVRACPVPNSPRPHLPIDTLLHSLADERGDGLAIVMTGAGADGTGGVRAVKEAGGIVMVQDPTEAEYPTMPQSAIGTGAVDFVGTLSQLARRITEVAQTKHAISELDETDVHDKIRQILAFLSARTGHDFAGYKRATVLRRIKRRIQLCRLASLDDYIAHLRDNLDEPKQLFGDLLISVTSFFRDPDAFEELRTRSIRPIVDKTENEIRAWVVGCASGEEAYSLAILLREESEQLGVDVAIQIFATDLDEDALAKARSGAYPRSIQAGVSPERLRRFFIDEGTYYRVSQELRDMVLFATHSVVREPPFTRLDLVSCRNVLIYLERQLQQQVTATFHYALKPGGTLFLGSAELPDMTGHLFDILAREARICVARPQVTPALPLMPTLLPRLGLVKSDGQRNTLPIRLESGELLTAVHAATLEANAPPSVVIDYTHRILNLSPSAGHFILLPGGPPTEKLPAIIRPELRGELMIALDRASNRGMPALSRSVDVQFDGDRRQIILHVSALPRQKAAEGRFLVCFLDGGPTGQGDDDMARGDAARDEIQRLHEALRDAQEATLISRAEHEASVQDLRVANEELQSLNEEYRSTAEELETSKEELQSINEELHTVNFELKSKIDIVSSAHNDLLNLTASSEIGTLFLDPDLKIRMLTPPVTALFSISETDVGRPITDFAHRLAYDGLERDVGTVLRSLTPKEKEISGPNGRWFLLRIRPYRTTDNKVSGVVVTFNDITDRRRDSVSKASEDRYRALVLASSDVVYRMSADWNEMLRLEGRGFLADTEEPTSSWMETYIDPLDRGRLQTEIDAAIRAKTLVEFEHRVRRLDGRLGWARSRAVPILDQSGEIVEWLGTAVEVTGGHDEGSVLQGREERLRHMIDLVPSMLWEANVDGDIVLPNRQWKAYTGQDDSGQAADGVGKQSWLDALHPDDVEDARAALLQAVPSDRATYREQRIRGADGTYRWFLVRHIPDFDADGQVLRWYGSATNIDELHEWKARQDRLRRDAAERNKDDPPVG